MPPRPDRIRLDQLVLTRGLASTIEQARGMISAGQVLVNEQPADKAGMLFAGNVRLRLRGAPCPYVSRGGLKLAAGLDYFPLSPAGLICADIGASTGGFTDCLLSRGAARVYAIDVGYGQLAWKLRQDPRVVVMERTNARKLKEGDIPESLNLAVVDASFISLAAILPPLLPLFSRQARIVALIKPQFEVAKGQLEKGGVIRNDDLHRGVIEKITGLAAALGLVTKGLMPSPLLGPKGNKEFLVYLVSEAKCAERN